MNKLPKSWTRRDFINAIASVSGTALMLDAMPLWAFSDVDPFVAKIVSSTIGIDTHNHIDVPLVSGEQPGPTIDLFGNLKKSGLSAICMTFAVDYQRLDQPGLAYERFLNGISAMDAQLKINNVKRSLNIKDIRTFHNHHQPTVIQSIEGAHFLEGKLERLKIAYDKGLRLLTLLHDNDASVPLGDVFTNPVRWNGLTKFGTAVIEECNKLGILVDLSHANVATVNAALKVAKYPVLVSHTGLDTQLGKNERMAKMMMPRLISKQHAKEIANAGGVIGVWTHLSDSALEYAQNIRAMVEVVGVDHVCIGTDTKLTPAYSSQGSNAQRSSDVGKKSGDTARKAQVGNQDFRSTGTNGNWKDQKEGFYYAVVESLMKTGLNEKEIGKIGGGNFLRIFNLAIEGRQK